MQQDNSRKFKSLTTEELNARQAKWERVLSELEKLLTTEQVHRLANEYTLEAMERGMARGKRVLLRMLRHEGEWS